MDSESPDFALQVEPDTQEVQAGKVAVWDVILTSLHGFASRCTLTASGLPPDAPADFDPNPVLPTDTSTLRVDIPDTSTPNSYTVTVTASEIDNGLVNTAGVVLIVIPSKSPGYYFPINFHYTWTYVRLGMQCVASEDSLVVTAQTETTRVVEGVSRSGWDLVAVAGSEGTGFVYQVADTIFYWRDVTNLSVLPNKVLVGPITEHAHWTDRPRHQFEYYIEGFEDLYSSVAGVTYRECLRIRRTLPGFATSEFSWWAPLMGKVKEAEVDQSGQCLSGLELKRLEISSDFP